jgi:Coenzyme PQQ synthesis protein D (PqqD)
MMTLSKLSPEEILASTIRVPPHVMLRSFDEETVVLNLDTGKYHSLNPIGGRCLQVLQETTSVGDALTYLRGRFPNQAPGVLQADLVRFCDALASARVIEIVERH